MHSRHIKLLALLSFLMTIFGCTPETKPTAKSIPLDATDENCKHENLLKIENETLRQELAAKCFRRGEYKPSPSKVW